MDPKSSKDVCVVGLGYIGLPTAAVLAEAGHRVHGVDVNQQAVDTINRGEIHIVEPELESYVKRAVERGLLKADVSPAPADVFLICVPTPFKHDREQREPQMDFVILATKAIAPHLKGGDLVILESTSPVGSTELVRDTLSEAGVDVRNLHFAYCPERVLPGNIMRELVGNDRIVGGLSQESTKEVADFYRTFVTEGTVLETDARTAELSKLVENSFRDVNIAFANELSLICHRHGINVKELIELANRHPRVNVLWPGSGVGGHCIAVDPWFVVAMDREHARLIRTAREVNDGKSDWVRIRIEEAADDFERKHGRKAKIAAMGLAFKPDIDDMRESPALAIAGKLVADGYEVMAVEPNTDTHETMRLVSIADAVQNADLIVFLVAHAPFKNLDTGQKPVLDFCGVQGYRFDRMD